MNLYKASINEAEKNETSFETKRFRKIVSNSRIP